MPVADVDKAKAFYQGLGWRLDADFPFDNGFRVVWFTPPGSACRVHGGGAGRDGAADVSDRDMIVLGCGAPGGHCTAALRAL